MKMGHGEIYRKSASIPAFDIKPDDHETLLAQLLALRRTYERPDAPTFMDSVHRFGLELPPELSVRLEKLRTGSSCGALVVRGMAFGDTPPTPAHWSERDRDATILQDFWLTLLAGQLGEMFCWTSLQAGRLLNDVVPVRGNEQSQTGAGSSAPLEFHVEDAFDDDRCDFLALLAIRNPNLVHTTLAGIEDIDTADLDLEALCEPRFVIEADPEHLAGLDTSGGVSHVRSVLTRSGASFRLRVDPAYTTVLPGDGRAARAFADLCARLEENIRPIALAAGDVLLFDNSRFVHGREPFTPRYDGTDRWLRKAMATRDLNRIGARRSGLGGRQVAILLLDAPTDGIEEETRG